MKWTSNRSKNVDDRRGMSGRGVAIGGGIGTLLVAVLIYFLGGDPAMVQNLQMEAAPQQTERQLSESELQVREFISMLAGENELSWKTILAEHNIPFRPATVVIFEQTTNSGCGIAQSAMGPFYCPADEKIYMDMSFFNELQNRFGARVTEFTIAYVLAHEMGHHIQNVLGTLSETEKLRRSGRYTEAQMNQISVATELQADFYAGLWARYTDQREKFLEPGDIESAVEAAAAVGDDNIQKRTQGYVNQEAFTHGSSEQRIEWFTKGYRSGDIRQGDTFSALLK
ncbi:MAG: neutral zinc metallopeptidase [Weeksellaceae bacterium]|mgnify:CR=1 FL=1|nr:neutral zinc metallopeptidase [Weeksellaceae bacterium]